VTRIARYSLAIVAVLVGAGVVAGKKALERFWRRRRRGRRTPSTWAVA
jgi:hypothetical protein